MKIKFILLIAVIFVSCTKERTQLKLIPNPQKIILQDLGFRLNQNTTIAIHAIDNFYIDELNLCIEKELNLKLLPSKEPKANYIEFLKIDSRMELRKCLTENELDEDYNTGEEGYILKIAPEFVKIIAQTNAGIFYGIQTLKQLISANTTDNKIPCLIIYDSPDISIRAWQDDISRGPIPTTEYLKKQIKKMASFKLNYFTLYTEHVFKLQKHPGIAPEDGITSEDIQALTNFAKKYNVTFIGNYQSFGHMEKTLRHPDYKYLAENSHIISPTLKESYEFLGDVYEEIVPVYSGQFFNINCDETFGLGEEKSKAMVDRIGIEGVYASHINKLDSLLKPYNKSILMWGDIATKYPGIVNQLPKNITVVAWGYHAADSFDYAITPISNNGLNFWVAPGINCWGNIFPNLHATEINIYNFIRDGYKYNLTGVLNTTWDDDGLNFFENNWHGLCWGAENSWSAPSPNFSKEASEAEREMRYSNFNLSFDAIFFGLKDESLTKQMIKFSDLHKSSVRDVERNNRFFEHVFPIHFEYVQKDKKEENEEVLEYVNSLSNNISSLKVKVQKNQTSVEFLEYAIRQVQFTVRKNMLRIDIHQFLEGDVSINKSTLKDSINALINELQLLKSQYKILWNIESKNYWLSENMAKFDKLSKSISDLNGHCIITVHDHLTEKGREITLHSIFDNTPIYYTFGEDTVSQFSQRYEKPLYFDEDVKIYARVIQNSRLYPTVKDSIIFHKGIGKLHKLTSGYSGYHPSYDGGGEIALLNGKLGNIKDIRSGRWQGFSGQNIELEIDMEKIEPINSFSMGFYQNTHSWVIFPKKVEVYSKNKIDEQYKLIKTITNTISPEEEGGLRQDYKTKFNNLETRYLKVIAYYFGKLPEWHHAGSEEESMIFADEIILE